MLQVAMQLNCGSAGCLCVSIIGQELDIYSMRSPSLFAGYGMYWKSISGHQGTMSVQMTKFNVTLVTRLRFPWICCTVQKYFIKCRLIVSHQKELYRMKRVTDCDRPANFKSFWLATHSTCPISPCHLRIPVAVQINRIPPCVCVV